VPRELIDVETGEVFEERTKKDPPPEASTLQYLGIDVKHPSECVTKDSFLESLKNLDACLHYKVDIDLEMLTEAVIRKMISVQELAVFRYICKKVVGWNYFIGNVKEFSKVVDPNNLSRCLAKLEENRYIEITHRNKPFRGDIVIKANPFYVWKGTYKFKLSSVEHWYSPYKNKEPIPLSSSVRYWKTSNTDKD